MNTWSWLDEEGHKKIKEALNRKPSSFVDAVSKVIVSTKADPQLFKTISMLPLNAELIYKKG